MKRILSGGIVAAAISCITLSAYAWPKCPDGSISLLSEAGKYVCPSPTPGGQPITVTDNITANPSADADAAAKAAADAIAKAIAQGGTSSAAGGDAKAISDNWNKLSADQQQKLMASLTNEQRQALTATLNSTMSNNSPSSATISGLSAGGGGANVTTNNTSSSKVLYVNLPVTPATAPTVAAAGGVTMVGTCGPLRQVRTIPIEYLLVGHVGMDKVTLSGQTTDVLEEVRDSSGKIIEFVTKDNGDGTYSEWGTIASTAIITVSASVSKQFGFGLVGSSGGGSASNGVGGTITGTQKMIATGSCEHRRYRVVPIAPPVPSVSKDEMKDALAALAGMKWTVEVPTQRVVTERRPCKLEKFTDESGKTVEMCRGPKGSYASSRVVDERVSASGRLEAGTKSAVEKK